MNTLRVRFKLNPGKKGIPLNKLSKQAENIESFLRSLASDLGQDGGTQKWLATNFRDGSFIGDMEYQALVEAERQAQLNAVMRGLSKFKTLEDLPDYVTPTTVEKFATLRVALDDGERLGVALFSEKTGKAGKFQYFDKLKLAEIGESIDTEVSYIGSVMGSTHEWNKGADKPYLIIRELATNDLVKCTYRDCDYSKVFDIFSKKTAMVVVEGVVLFNRMTGKSEVTEAIDFNFSPEFSNADFEAFFGCAPGLTGTSTSEELIAKGRADE
jgi:hypothetical protein